MVAKNIAYKVARAIDTLRKDSYVLDAVKIDGKLTEMEIEFIQENVVVRQVEMHDFGFELSDDGTFVTDDLVTDDALEVLATEGFWTNDGERIGSTMYEVVAWARAKMVHP